MSKICSSCKEEKDDSQFGKSPRYKSGLTSQCKACQYDASKRWKAKRREGFEERLRSDGEKRCNRCEKTKPRTEFHIDSTKSDGRKNVCQKCACGWQQSRYLGPEHEVLKEQFRRNAAKQREDNPISYLLSGARQRAKKRGFEFSITKDDLEIPERCPILGIPLRPTRERYGGFRDNSPSIDRIDNSKGYTPENSIVISMRANSIKRDATLEELEKIVAFLKSVSKDQS